MTLLVCAAGWCGWRASSQWWMGDRTSPVMTRQIQLIAAFTRRVPFRGSGRLLRLLHRPTSREGAIEAIVPIGDDLVMSVNTSSDVEWSLFFYGNAKFEPAIRPLLRSWIRPATTEIDVRANVGVNE